MTAIPCSDGRRWGAVAALVLLAAGVLFLARLGDRGVVSEELRWAEVAREMRQTGDYFAPTINGRTYYDKPVGSYWLIVAASHLTGGVDETAARLPAALAGWVGVLLVMSLAGRLYDGRTAVLAGAVLATSFGFAFYSRRATADVETVTGVLASVWLYERNRNRAGPWVLLLWLAMAATSLTKGLLGFALPVVVLGVHGVLNALWRAGGVSPRVDDVHPGAYAPGSPNLCRRLVTENRWLFNPWTLLAAPLAFALYLLPFVVSSWQTGAGEGLAMVYRENVKRFFAPHNHTGPAYLYLGVVLVLAAPWSAFLPAALLGRGTRPDADRLVKAYFWAVFVFFTLSASRRSYYLLPVLPATALLVGRVLATSANELSPLARRLRAVGFGVFGIGVVAAGAFLVPPAALPGGLAKLPELPARWLFAAGWAVALAAFAWAGLRARPRLVPVAAGVAFAGLAFALLVGLPADGFRTRRAFADAVRDRVAGDPDRLALFHARDVVFDLAPPAPLPEYASADALTADARAGRVRWVIARRRYLAGAGWGAAVCAEAVYPWDGPDQVGDKMVLLEVRADQ